MTYFVQANEFDMNMHARLQDIIFHLQSGAGVPVVVGHAVTPAWACRGD
jgi:hypothetical protein